MPNRSRTIREIFEDGKTIDEAVKRAVRRAILENEAYTLIERALRKDAKSIRAMIREEIKLAPAKRRKAV